MFDARIASHAESLDADDGFHGFAREASRSVGLSFAISDNG
jgi:hypothetical protein